MEPEDEIIQVDLKATDHHYESGEEEEPSDKEEPEDHQSGSEDEDESDTESSDDDDDDSDSDSDSDSDEDSEEPVNPEDGERPTNQRWQGTKEIVLLPSKSVDLSAQPVGETIPLDKAAHHRIGLIQRQKLSTRSLRASSKRNSMRNSTKVSAKTSALNSAHVSKRGSLRASMKVSAEPELATSPSEANYTASDFGSITEATLKERVKLFKRTRPVLRRKDYEEAKIEHTFAGHTRNNIRNFFKYNRNKLVRKDLEVDDKEQKKARTWTFTFIILQIIFCVTYGAIVYNLRNEFAYYAYAILMGAYFFFKLGSVIIFVIRTKQWKRRLSSYDPAGYPYKEIFICIPAYNEGKEAFLNTVTSIVESNYPKDKLYMLFIVDGNKANSFESLMSVLLGREYTEPVKPNERLIADGVFKDVAWSVFLKEQNRGKRDSQWLFVEIMRNMVPEYKPPYVFFVDSDTSFHPDSLRHLSKVLDKDKTGRVAGVCGQLQLSNWSNLTKGMSWNSLFYWSTTFIVGYQYYEYHFNQILGKQAEGAYGSVTCLPGAFSLFRSKYIVDIEASIDLKEIENRKPKDFGEQLETMTPQTYLFLQHQQVVPITLEDFFSKATKGIVDRNLYELGEDRTLTVRFLERGLVCMYEPRAIAYTECPDTLRLFILQRRRWNNSTFVNLFMMLIKPRLWFQLKSFPVMIFCLFDLFGAYILPANAVLLMLALWTPLFKTVTDGLNFPITSEQVIIAYMVIQIVVIASTKMDSSDVFYTFIGFLSGGLMAVCTYWFFKDVVIGVVKDFINDPSSGWPVFVLLLVFPVLNLVVSIPRPHMFLTAVFYWLMLPTIATTLPLYSFFHLDDFSWGNR